MMCSYLWGGGGAEPPDGGVATGTGAGGWCVCFFFFLRCLRLRLAWAIATRAPPWTCTWLRHLGGPTLGVPSFHGRRAVRDHRSALRRGHRDHRPGQGQLVLPLVFDRDRDPALRAGRGDSLPLRAHRAGAPMPDLPEGPEAPRPGLPPMRYGPLPAGPGRGSPRPRRPRSYLSQVRTIALVKPSP